MQARRPRRPSSPIHFTGRAVTAVLPVLFFLTLLALPAAAAPVAATGEEETTLSGSGIHYPGGYDPNTAAVVEGRVAELHWPCCGPVSFTLLARRDRYTVLTAPASHWLETGLNIPPGTAVKVTGSKAMGRDGKLYLVAAEVLIVPTGAVISFRDTGGNPGWKCRQNAHGQGGGRGGHGMGRGRQAAPAPGGSGAGQP